MAFDRISPGDVAAMMGYYSILNKIIGEINGHIRRIPILDNLAERLTYFYEDAEFCDKGEKLQQIHKIHGDRVIFCQKIFFQSRQKMHYMNTFMGIFMLIIYKKLTMNCVEECVILSNY